MLADIVSKNGNLLLNFPLRPDGSLDAEEEKILAGITSWMEVNSEAIHATRPWRVYGEGPAQVQGGHFNEGKLRYTAEDIRFAVKGRSLYAIALAWPETGTLAIRSLAGAEVSSIRMLGVNEPLKWKRGGQGLAVEMPPQKPCEHAFALRIEGAAGL